MTTEDYILELRRRGLQRGEQHQNLMLEVAERMAEQVRDINRLKDEVYRLKTLQPAPDDVV